MADPARRWPDNAPGPWYVDSECIDCRVCRDLAPATFDRCDVAQHSFVAAQPVTDDELRAAEVARSDCPVEAIGSGEGVDGLSTLGPRR